jgi:hypothetical protein
MCSRVSRDLPEHGGGTKKAAPNPDDGADRVVDGVVTPIAENAVAPDADSKMHVHSIQRVAKFVMFIIFPLFECCGFVRTDR